MGIKTKILIITIILFTGFTVGKTVHAAISIHPMLNTGLVGYWGMDEGTGTTVNDHSGNRNNGTASGSPAWVDGKLGKALDFNGTNEVQSVDQDYFSPANNDLTISFWAKIPVGASADGDGNCGWTGRYFIAKQNDPGNAEWGFENDNNTKLCFDLWQSGGTDHGQVETNRTLNDGLWHYYAATVDYLNRLELYVDAVSSVATTTFVGNMDNGAKEMQIGRRGDGNFFVGTIDEVRIYNRALSAGEITRLYNLTKPKIKAASDNGLVGYWSFDEGLGTKAGDMSGRGNNGNITGASWVDGKRGKALDFNGSSGNMNLGDVDAVDGLSALTVCTWVKPTDVTRDYEHIISKAPDNPITGWQLTTGGAAWGGGGNDILVVLGTGSSYTSPYTEGDYLSDGNWTYVCFVYNGSLTGNSNRFKIFTDGAQRTLTFSAPAVPASLTANAVSLEISDDPGGTGDDWYKGLIDEVRIYNRALSATEVASLYNASKKIMKVNTPQNTKLTTGLVGMWTFNGQDMLSSTLAKDVTGNGYVAYLLNGAKLTSGRVGQGLTFDANNDVVLASTTSIGEGSALTVAAWVRFNNPTNNVTKEIVAKDKSAAGQHQWTLFKNRNNSTGALTFGVYNSSDVLADAQSDTPWPTDTNWHHVAGVYDGAYVYVYGDGVSLDSTPPSQTGSIKSYGNYICFGGEFTGATCDTASGGYQIDGDLDEVRIYSRALTASEIKRLYNLGK
jgi:hypothetical protein